MKTTIALALIAASAAVASAGPKDNTWTQAKDAKWSPLDPSDKSGKGPQFTVVFGDPAKGPVGVILKVPPGFRPGPHTHTSDDYAVIIQGNVHNFKSTTKDEKNTGPAMTPGGSWFQPGGAAHDNECEKTSKDGCMMFVYMEKGFDFKPYAADAKKPDAPKKDEKPAPKK
jgi:hypothetical protein